MYKYDKNTGPAPILGDFVESTHLGDSLLDGTYIGTIVGWTDQSKSCAIVLLDKELTTGEKAISIPIVCLTLKDF